MELVPLIERLTESSNGEKQATFDIVIPSLIGYGLSSPAPDGWNATDSARVFHTLMTEILGYEKYATHGTDWGCTVAYQMYNAYNESARASHFSIIPFRPPTREQIQEQNITLSEGESFQLQRATDWETSGSSYFYLQTTKVGHRAGTVKIGMILIHWAAKYNWPRVVRQPNRPAHLDR